MSEFAEKLRSTRGKKVYGYLPPQVKRIADEIVDELAKDERVSASYLLWQDMQDAMARTYTDELPERVPLSQQKEFKPVRNMVIREMLRLAEREITFYDEGMDNEPEPEMSLPHSADYRSIYELTERYRKAKRRLYDEPADADKKRNAIAKLEKLWDEGCTAVAHHLGKAYRDDLSIAVDTEKAVEWFRRSAERETICSAYCLGKPLLTTGASEEAIRWPKYAADGGDQFAQYALGKLYLLGQEVPPDREQTVDYLSRSASQGNKYTQYFLDHLNDTHFPSVGLVVLDMFRHMANIFRNSTSQDATSMGLHINRKRRRELQKNRIAMGHKPDDHEDEKMNQAMR